MLSICGFIEMMTVGMCPEEDDNIISYRSTNNMPKIDYEAMKISGSAYPSVRNYVLEQENARMWLAERAALRDKP